MAVLTPKSVVQLTAFPVENYMFHELWARKCRMGLYLLRQAESWILYAVIMCIFPTSH